MMGLTKRQRDLMIFMRDYMDQNGVSPSFDEMVEALGLSSKSGIHRMITALEERGFVRRLPGRARALELLGEWAVPVEPPIKVFTWETNEDRLHRSVAEYLRTVHPDLVWYHPANGGWRSAREAGKLKAMGVLAGVCDLAFILPGGQAAFIELKAAKGALSIPQKVFIERAERNKAWVAVCRSIDEVIATLADWGVQARSQRSAA
jgi:hypothetical protein